MFHSPRLANETNQLVIGAPIGSQSDEKRWPVPMGHCRQTCLVRRLRSLGAVERIIGDRVDLYMLIS